MTAWLSLRKCGDDVCGDSFAVADGVDALVGLGLERNLFSGNAEGASKSFAHFREMLAEFGFFENDDRIDILNHEVLPAKQFSSVFQEEQAVRAFPLRIRIRKQLADIAEPSRAKQRIAYRVSENVAVGMANRAFVKRKFDAADD